MKKPLRVFIIYIIITLIISFFGPAYYVGYDKFIVLIFMSVFLMLFYLGYNVGLKIKTKEYKDNVKYKKNFSILILIIKISILISLFSVSIEFLEAFIKNPSAFSLANIGQNYLYIRQYLEQSDSYSLGIILRFLTGIFRNINMSLGIYYFNKLSRKFKYLLIFSFVLIIFSNSILYGTQKMLGDIVIFGLVIGAIKMMKIDKKKRYKIVRYSLILVLTFTVFMVINQVQRYEEIGINLYNYSNNSVNGIYFNYDHLIFKIFGDKFGFGLALILTSYLSSGYYGLSLTLKLPFQWTYGIGSSYVLSLFFERFLGISIYERTYLYRMESIYGRLGADSWNTIFPWLASDMTFIGSILFFIFVAAIFGYLWKEVIKYNNPISILAFTTLVLGLVFVPANNQLFLGIDGFISTWLTIIIWILFHRKFNFIGE